MGRARSDIGPRIVEAARGRFLREGVDGASLRAIAADARTSIGMVYYYFPTKDELFFAVVEDAYTGLLEGFAAAFAPDTGVEGRLRRLFHRIGAMSEREQTTIRLILREILISSKRLRRLIERFQRGHFPIALAAIEEGQRDGAIQRALHPMLAMMLAFAVGAIPQFAVRQIGPQLAPDLPHGAALGDVLVDVLFHGIGAAPPVQRARRRPRRRVDR